MLLESIKLKDGVWFNLSYHQGRVDRSRQALFPTTTKPLLLDQFLSRQKIPKRGLFKARLLYKQEISSFEFQEYQIKPVHSLRLIEANHLDYRYKFLDREKLQYLYEKRRPQDDILIVKNGLLTDSFYANVALYDGKQWCTPSQPLLAGVKRASLMDKGILIPKDIYPNDLNQFIELRLINAMIDLEDEVKVAIDNINW